MARRSYGRNSTISAQSATKRFTGIRLIAQTTPSWHVLPMGHDQSHLATLASKMSTSSAMNPGLLFCLIVCPLAIIGAVSLFQFGHPLAAGVFTAIACYPIGIVGWQLIKFTNTDPNRLQRDEHVQKMFALRHTLGVKDHDTLKEITVSGDLTGNPVLEDRSGE